MAVEIYSDLDSKLRKISSTKDVNKVINEDAINQSLLSLFLTRRGERPFRPDYGTNISNLIFEPLDKVTANSIAEEITHGLEKEESERVKLLTLQILIDEDARQFNIHLEYNILNTQKTGELSFILKAV